MEKRLLRGELAKRARVNIETLRYYERRGMIPEPDRTDAGYRQYSEEMVLRVRFIKNAQELGFTLEEILELLSIRLATKNQCKRFEGEISSKSSVIKEKISGLKRIKSALENLRAQCSRGPHPSKCPILDFLYSGG